MDIFVDWGSTNFRAFLMDGPRIVERTDSPGNGVLQSFLKIPAQQRSESFSRFLHEQLRSWLTAYPEAEIFMCGAIGSREGWMNTGYVSASADLKKMSENLYSIDSAKNKYLSHHKISILPGLTIVHKDDRHDVMRSEEIKSLGAAAHLDLKDTVFCVPGTHCKWVRMENGAITDFHSILTGEFYSLLGSAGFLESILSESDDSEEPNLNSFRQGLALAQEGQDLLADIWQVRCQKMCAEHPPEDLRAYFSGILIGHELRQINLVYPGMKNTVLLGDSGPRQNLYRHALENDGWTIAAEISSETAVCAGFSALKAQR